MSSTNLNEPLPQPGPGLHSSSSKELQAGIGRVWEAIAEPSFLLVNVSSVAEVDTSPAVLQFDPKLQVLNVRIHEFQCGLISSHFSLKCL